MSASTGRKLEHCVTELHKALTRGERVKLYAHSPKPRKWNDGLFVDPRVGIEECLN